MQKYLLFESRDPMECRDWVFTENLAKNLMNESNTVIVFLVENGVFPARRSRYSSHLEAMMENGVSVWVDSFSLRERGIHEDSLIKGLVPKEMSDVIACLSENYKVLWH